MKKRPFKKKLEYRTKHPHRFKRLIFHPTLSFVNAFGLLNLKEAIRFNSKGIKALQIGHFHGMKWRGVQPHQILEAGIDLGSSEGDQNAEILMKLEEPSIWKGNENFEACGNCNPEYKCREAGCVEEQGLTEFYRRVK